MSSLTLISQFHEGVACVNDGPGDLELPVNMLEAFYHGNWLPGRCWFINQKGQIAISPRKPEEADDFSESLAAVKVDAKWGFIDHSGVMAIAPQFEQVRQFNGGLARVMSHGKWGYIDRRGRQVIEPRFDGAISFSEGLAAVSLKNRIGFINTKGNLVVKPQFEYAGAFSEGVAFVMDESKKFMGYIDKSGSVALRIEFDKTQIGLPTVSEGDLLLDFPLDRSLTTQPEKFGTLAYIARSSGITDIHSFSEGVAVFKKGNLYGYIDHFGKAVIEPKFDFAYPFSNGRAAVIKSGRFGYIDRSGNLVVDAVFQCASRFSEGLAPAKLNDKWGYINSKGAFTISPKFERTYPFSEGFGRVGGPTV